MIRCSTSLIIRAIRTTMRYLFTPLAGAIIKKKQITSVGKDRRKGNPWSLFVGVYIGATTVENSTEIPQTKTDGSWNLSGGPVAKSPRSNVGTHASSLVRELDPTC